MCLRQRATKTLLLASVLLFTSSLPAHGARGEDRPRNRKAMIKAAADKKAEDALRAKLECEYGILTADDLSVQLENLMGEADKSLDIVDYGSEQAKDYARRIRAMANQLIQKTSTDNKLALEGFVFAREISAQE